MPIEIESKLKVDSHDKIINKLNEIGAEFMRQVHQKDSYFDDASATMLKADKALRIRCQSDGSKQDFFLTYKGPKEKISIKKRKEVEIKINDFNSAKELLLLLGYNEKLVVEKKRRIWQLDNCEIALDEIPMLGCFVEIEGPDNKKIVEVQKRLGLSDKKHITKSYAHLMQEKLAQ